MKIACAVVIREKKVLVQKRLRRGVRVHEFPMGKVDEGESFAEAAVRELLEETGLSGVPGDVQVMENSRNIEVAFVFIDISREAQPQADSDRQQEFFWLSWDDIPLGDFHEVDRQFIEEMKKS